MASAFHLEPILISGEALVHIAVPVFFTVTVTSLVSPAHQAEDPVLTEIISALYTGVKHETFKLIPAHCTEPSE